MNRIVIELCAEDRARIDSLTAALERAASANAPTDFRFEDPIQKRLAETMAKVNNPEKAPTEAAKNTTEPAEAETLTTEPPTEEKPTEADRAPWDPIESFAQHGEQPKPEKAKPAITIELLQQKVVQLAAHDGGKRKAKVREVINSYAPKVSDIPEDKWHECWQRLLELV